ncbi:hypothetical protein JKP88DRAFT_281961 [Tribonema minus]|uniref:Uncharacterized protein n=1 Tax=Tribonema minus TaxID=303371 RepID=A0A835YKP8_9STRA|nr:hypothetical protein JKP88DRAFT_281961 [Tribonema minus]
MSPTTVGLSWTAPVSPGHVVTSYVVEVKAAADSDTSYAAISDTITGTTVTATGLAEGTSYLFRVKTINQSGLAVAQNYTFQVFATNAAGEGAGTSAYTQLAAAVRTGIYAAIQLVYKSGGGAVATGSYGGVVMANATQLQVVLDATNGQTVANGAPLSNNADIAYYRIEYQQAGTTDVSDARTVDGSAQSIDISGLNVTQSYTFWVYATNLAGEGAASAATTETVILPGFVVGATASLADQMAGAETALTLSFTMTEDWPADGALVLALPVEVIASTSDLALVIAGIVNPGYSGTTSSFRRLTATAAAAAVLCEASAAFSPFDLPAGLDITPSHFNNEVPVVTLNGGLAAGTIGTLSIALHLGNDLPSDGVIAIALPATFAAVASVSASVTLAGTPVDGGTEVVAVAHGGDGSYTVTVARVGGGTPVPAGARIVVTIDRVQNQRHAGGSGAFPSVTTYVAIGGAAIDVWDSADAALGAIAGVDFTYASFAAPPLLALSSALAGASVTAAVTLQLSNPLPTDARIFLGFPPSFYAVAPATITLSGSVDGGAAVAWTEDPASAAVTVEVARAGVTAVPELSTVTLELDGIVNQRFEGWSGVVQCWTMLADGVRDIDRGDGNEVLFTPSDWQVDPVVTLNTYVAGETGGATITFMPRIPLPANGTIVIEFPSTFVAVACTEAVSAQLDGLLTAVTSGHTVTVARDESGTEMGMGTLISIYLPSGVSNQRYEAPSGAFPLIRTALSDGVTAIEQSSAAADASAAPAAAVSIVAAAVVDAVVTLQYTVAGLETQATVTFTLANVMPAAAHVEVVPPADFPGFTPTEIVSTTGSDGGWTITPGYASGFLLSRDGVGSDLPPATTVSFTLSSVTNPSAVAVYGTFAITVYTDFEGAPRYRTEAGASAPVAVTHGVTAQAAAVLGADDVAVALQAKGFNFVGHGMAAGDEILWVAASATADYHCATPNMIVQGPLTVMSTAASSLLSTVTVTFQEDSQFTGPLKLCYRFAEGGGGSATPYKLYSFITTQVYRLSAVTTAAAGSTTAAVVGAAKVLTLSGFGVAAGDRALWITAGADCAASVAPLQGGGGDGASAAFVTTAQRASFTFASGAFGGAVAVGASSAQQLSLCYRFGAEAYRHEPDVALALFHAQGWTSTTGGAAVAVAEVPEVMMLNVFGARAGDLVRWAPAGGSCAAAAAAAATAESAGGQLSTAEVAADGGVTVTFEAAAAGLSPMLCYKFSDEPWMAYPQLTIDVAYASAFAPAFGDLDTAVAGYSKSWTFSGGHLVSGDQVKWIPSGGNCLDADSLSAALNYAGDGTAVASAGAVTVGDFNFPVELAGQQVTVCYSHGAGSEPYRAYDVTLDIKTVSSFEVAAAGYGHAAHAVAEQLKSWTVAGQFLATDGSMDSVMFVANAATAADCISGSAIVNADAGTLSAAEKFVGADGLVEIEFAASAATASGADAALRLCYRHGAEPYMLYDSWLVTVHMATGIASSTGAPTLAVADAQEVWLLDGCAIEPGDQLRLLPGASTDAACETAETALALGVEDPAATAVTLFLDVAQAALRGAGAASAATAAFLLRAEYAGQAATACVKFATEHWKAYEAFGVSVAMVQGVSVPFGAADVAVAEYTKPWTFSGPLLAAGDQAFWADAEESAAEQCDPATALSLMNDGADGADDSVMTAPATLAVDFQFAFAMGGRRGRLCYRFADEPWKSYPNFTIEVRALTSVAVNAGAWTRAVPGLPKLFRFAGYGTAAAADVDAVKWVPAAERCDAAQGVLAAAPATARADAAPARDFKLTYDDASGRTARALVFPDASIGGPYTLCYAFATEPYMAYPNLYLAVVGISGVAVAAGRGGAADVLVVGQPKELVFAGYEQVQDGDEAWWITSTATLDDHCSVASLQTGPAAVVGGDGALGVAVFSERLGTVLAARDWVLCYRFNTESAVKLYRDIKLTAVTLRGVAALAGCASEAVAGQPKTLTLSGEGLQPSDAMIWVAALAASDADCAPAAAAAATLTVATSTSTSNSTVAAATLLATVTFAAATPGDALIACYAPAGEPFALRRDLRMAVSALASAAVRGVVLRGAAAAASVAAVAGTAQTVTFSGTGVREGDRAAWVAAAVRDCAAAEAAAAGGGGGGSAVSIVGGPFSDASFTFSAAAQGLQLCYGFGAEPLALYAAVTARVVAPAAGDALAVTRWLVAGAAAATPVTLAGTFGLVASAPYIKLVSGDAADCSAAYDAVAGAQPIQATAVTPPAAAALTDGAATFPIALSAATPANKPYRVCARFGGGAGDAWLLSDGASVAAAAVDAVAVVATATTDSGATAVTFEFTGGGLASGDTALFVQSTITTSAACATATGVSGSAAASVGSDLRATMTLSAVAAPWNLCYRHAAAGQWQLYANMAVTMRLESSTTSSASSSAEEESGGAGVSNGASSATQRTKVVAAMKTEGDIGQYPAGSAARTSLIASFTADLATALGLDASRFEVTGVSSGSLVFSFVIWPSASLADKSTVEVLSTLQAQIDDPSSALYTGTVTKTAVAGYLKFTTEVVEVGPAEAALAAQGFATAAVLPYQLAGLVTLSSSEYFATEADGAATLTVLRTQGTGAVVVVKYSVTGGTATAGVDYTGGSGQLRFDIGEVSKTFSIGIVNDRVPESFFETVIITLSVETLDAAAGSPSSATLYIYDFGAGSPVPALAEANFNSGGAHGWSVTGNGDGYAPWVAPEAGLGVSDAIVGAAEYDAACDFAAAAPCNHDCAFGGALGAAYPLSGASPGVLRLSRGGHAVSAAPLRDFPPDAFTVSLWARRARGAADASAQRPQTLLSYVRPGAPRGAFDLLVTDEGDSGGGLRVLVAGEYIHGAANDRRGLRTGARVAGDGAWHHVALAWRAADGRVAAYVDGAHAFEGGPYAVGAALAPGGALVLGRGQFLGACACEEAGSAGAVPRCAFSDADAALDVDVQALQLWDRMLSAAEVALLLHTPFDGATAGQVLYWEFAPERMTPIAPTAAAAAAAAAVPYSAAVADASGGKNGALLSARGAALVPGTPSLNPNYPCGEVYSGIWHYAAPAAFVTALRAAYGGRLQLTLAATAAGGARRARRGAVVVATAAGARYSHATPFAPPDVGGSPRHLSVVLREDHGWAREPGGEAVSAEEFKGALSDAAGLYIRGDMWVFSSTGGGQEEAVTSGAEQWTEHSEQVSLALSSYELACWAHEHLSNNQKELRPGMAQRSCARCGDVTGLRLVYSTYHLPLLSDHCCLAAAGGHLEAVQWLRENGCSWTEDSCAAAATNGHLRVLQWLRDHGCPWDTTTCDAAAGSGRLAVLQWARANGCPWDTQTCSIAAEHGHLGVLQWSRANGCPWGEDTCNSAAGGGHLEVLQWARANGCPWVGATCAAAAKCEHVTVLRWLRANECPWDTETCRQAARHGQLATLQWARANGCPWNHETCSGAAEGGHLAVLQWACANGCPCYADTCHKAAEHGRLAVLQWARAYSCPWGDRTCFLAAANGHLEVLQWARANGCPWDERVGIWAEKNRHRAEGLRPDMAQRSCARCGDVTGLRLVYTTYHLPLLSDHCCLAAAGGHLEAVQWLRDNGCPWAVDSCAAAASNGRLKLLKWLRDHGCPWDTTTCDAAAGSGRLAVLQWARANGCPWDTQTCSIAAEHGHLGVLQWSRANGCPWGEDTCNSAAGGGHLEVLQWARANGCPWVGATCAAAAKCEHVTVLRWLRANECPWDTETCRQAARHGQLATLQWARANGCPWNHETCSGAAEGGHLAVLQWACANGCPCYADTCHKAAEHGRLAVLQWARAYSCPWGDRTCFLAAANGHLEVLQWARANGCPWDERVGIWAEKNRHRAEGLRPDMAQRSCARCGDVTGLRLVYTTYHLPLLSDHCCLAAAGGHLEAVQWLRDNGCPWAVDSCAAAASNGRLKLLKWLRDHGCPWDTTTCDAAAGSGRLAVLQWARANGCPWDTRTCSIAAERGHLGVLQWLRANGCPWGEDSCNSAAGSGHLEALQWARANGCPWSSATCVAAAKYGHVAVLRWLHATECPRLAALQWARANGCPWNHETCSGAAAGGHLGVLQWACANGCPCYADTCHKAAEHGRLAVLQWARANGCPWDGRICFLAAANGHLEVLQWARANGCPWDKRVCIWAANNGHHAVLEWARARGCPTQFSPA